LSLLLGLVAAPLVASAQGIPIPLQPQRDRAPTQSTSPAPAPAPAARAIERNAAPPKVPSQDAMSAVQRANAWLNSSQTLIADFTQIGGDGRKTEGELYVQRPGRLRFEYASPATLQIIADGTSVAVRDKKLATQDLYFINQTPLKFLLKSDIDISRDTRILDVKTDAKTTSIFIEDKATFGGTSHIRLVFDTQTSVLQQWTVTDPQGYETLVRLSNHDVKTKPPSDLFKIDMQRFN
jgi:outer membrane lipoprotein-sorting protein